MRTESSSRELSTKLHGVTFQKTVILPFTAVRNSKRIALYIMFTDVHTHNKEKSGSVRLPVADAALPREVLFH